MLGMLLDVPQGVEHQLAGRWSSPGMLGVMSCQMPQGVEHANRLFTRRPQVQQGLSKRLHLNVGSRRAILGT